MARVLYVRSRRHRRRAGGLPCASLPLRSVCRRLLPLLRRCVGRHGRRHRVGRPDLQRRMCRRAGQTGACTTAAVREAGSARPRALRVAGSGRCGTLGLTVDGAGGVRWQRIVFGVGCCCLLATRRRATGWGMAGRRGRTRMGGSGALARGWVENPKRRLLLSRRWRRRGLRAPWRRLGGRVARFLEGYRDNGLICAAGCVSSSSCRK